MERRTGKTHGAFSGMHRALDGGTLACAPASPAARGFHHYRSRVFEVSLFLQDVWP